MSRIRGKNTKPELIVRKYLYSKGLRYRLKSNIFGKPDLVFPERKIALFVHGCFWHLHGCRYSVMPQSNREFWKKKIEGNRKRDRTVKTHLKKKGWNVLTVWECELRDKPQTLSKLFTSIIKIKKKNKKIFS